MELKQAFFNLFSSLISNILGAYGVIKQSKFNQYVMRFLIFLFLKELHKTLYEFNVSIYEKFQLGLV